MIFRDLELWIDPLRRSGPENMAVDEWLLEKQELPLLRVYQWDGNWGSIGYFGELAEAQYNMGDLKWVRRWTGGGVVDHRNDWTYSLMIPRGSAAARMKSAESYRVIHDVLVKVLSREGVMVALSGGVEKSGDLCFQNPVEFDVVGVEDGRKLAGAAQRRSKNGLLHQGSVALADGDNRAARGKAFAGCLAENWHEARISVDSARISELIGLKYGTATWLGRR
ncbi:hypothetical protein ACFSSA_04580 [Luteolibacter algae]|uniref:BPL/LPL catalytic domain-containing protein n=1 Tax=Luteolibacter algae TaxID=454151 RepID=A0ABW5D5W1_9BACT